MVSNVYDHSSSSSDDNEYMMQMCNYFLKSMNFLDQNRLLKKAGSQLICYQPFLFKKIAPEWIALFVPQWFWMSAHTVSVAMDLPVIQNTGVQFSETTASTGTPILRWPSDFPVPSLLHRDFILATFIFHVSGIVYPYVIAHVTQKLQIHRFL